MQGVRVAAAVRLTRSVSAEKRDFIVDRFVREELHLLRVVLSTQWAILQRRMIARVLKRGHYLGQILDPSPLAQDLDKLRRLLQAQRPDILLR